MVMAIVPIRRLLAERATSGPGTAPRYLMRAGIFRIQLNRPMTVAAESPTMIELTNAVER